MPNGRSANVRSHRRGGNRRRGSLWLILGIVFVLVASGATAGWVYVKHRDCTGHLLATVVAAPDIAPILQTLNSDWAKTKPSVGGKCVSVNINSVDSLLVTQQLSGRWDTKSDGAPPDVWVPESSVWIRQASVSPTAEPLMPDLQPSLARSPSVIAMPRDMATTLGWPNTTFDWPDIAKDASDPAFWTGHGKTWGKFQFTMTDPETSTAGLLALMAIADADNSGSVDQTESDGILKLNQTKHGDAGGTGDILKGLAAADAQSTNAALSYVSAFPALEQDVISYNRNDPKEPLVAVYPKSGSYDADHPYLILRNPKWGTPGSLTAATAFEAYVRGPHARLTFLAAGFRDSNRRGNGKFTSAAGVQGNALVLPLPRAVLVPDSVRQTLYRWTAVSQQANMLIVLDVSGSMDNVVKGSGKTRLQLAKIAALNAIQQFDPQSRVGLWEFATQLDGTKDYKSLVSLGPLGETLPDGKTRGDELTTAVNGLTAHGNTGLYNTIAAAQAAVRANYVPNATNVVVLMTDGQDDPRPNGGIDLTQLESKLVQARNSRTNVPIVTVALSADADAAVLEEISRKSGTVSLTSQTGFDLNQVLLSALFGVAVSGQQ